jgi:cold shock CspA family protein
LRGVVKKWLYDHGFGFIKVKKTEKEIFYHSRDVGKVMTCIEATLLNSRSRKPIKALGLLM